MTTAGRAPNEAVEALGGAGPSNRAGGDRTRGAVLHARRAGPRGHLTGLLLLAIPFSACGGGPLPENVVAPDRRPDIVLVSVDSLRPDHLGCYGSRRETSPVIDGLADEGVLFEVATSTSSWTLPAHASLFTGLPPFVHGVDRGSRNLGAARRTLAESLKAAGYRTLGVWSGPLLDPRFGFDQGFDAYRGHLEEGGGSFREGTEAPSAWEASVASSRRDISGPSTLERVKELLDTVGPDPFFLFVHLWDVHYDFVRPASHDRFSSSYDGPVDGRGLVELVLEREEPPQGEDLERLVALYDGEIAGVDHQIGRILDMLEGMGRADPTVIAVTSDHGEEFYERGAFGHKKTLFEESIRIPLVIRLPGAKPGGLRLEQPVSLLDVAPTLLDLAGAEPLPGASGRSLLPVIREGAPPPNAIGERPVSRGAVTISELTLGPEGRESLLALRTAQWKLMARPGVGEIVGLWDLSSDPDELFDLRGKDPGLEAEALRVLRFVLQELEESRRRHAPLHPAADPLAPEVRAQLESLGYLETSRVPGDEELPPILLRPDPIVVCGAPPRHGVAEVVWSAPETVGALEIRIGGPEGQLFAQVGHSGSLETGEWVQEGLEFVLMDTGHRRVLGTVRARITDVGCPVSGP